MKHATNLVAIVFVDHFDIDRNLDGYANQELPFLPFDWFPTIDLTAQDVLFVDFAFNFDPLVFGELEVVEISFDSVLLEAENWSI